MEEQFESRAEKWYESKLTFGITVLAPVVLVILFLGQMRTDIEVIKQQLSDIKNTIERQTQVSEEILQEHKDIQVRMARIEVTQGIK